MHTPQWLSQNNTKLQQTQTCSPGSCSTLNSRGGSCSTGATKPKPGLTEGRTTAGHRSRNNGTRLWYPPRPKVRLPRASSDSVQHMLPPHVNELMRVCRGRAIQQACDGNAVQVIRNGHLRNVQQRGHDIHHGDGLHQRLARGNTTRSPHNRRLSQTTCKPASHHTWSQQTRGQQRSTFPRRSFAVEKRRVTAAVQRVSLSDPSTRVNCNGQQPNQPVHVALRTAVNPVPG
jgi:hypothetical protein